ncbi:uncharacterized protein LY89DRAFT_13540 [Mollisia scopiformis]|uniref:Uncharacterized protein n=1 Tax=Mollisia scopiformis TaxID=149040 RepID=A0A194XVJ0_MOLSC|nr:uncharacterized protein LY89DRAFT_13540 [Mollisia scopiformis]KUJ24151.1 hypothetical protein LY89DRAFT_13540 [Mollisia scopiformis]
MKSVLSLTSLLALAAAVVAADDDDACENEVEIRQDTTLKTSTSTFAANVTNVFAPVTAPHVDTQDIANIVPQSNVSLYYASNITTSAGLVVNHTMALPAVLLEEIASISSVDCTPSSVAVTFNDSSFFAAAESVWTSNGTFVMITNHLGDCDPELERSFFVVDSLSFDNTTLVATASSLKSNVSSTAAKTQISFGAVPGVALAKRDLTIDPSFTISPSLALTPDTVLYSYSPYVTVTADTASFTSNVTLSGYLEYNWFLFKMEKLYIDIDAGFTADLAISAEVTSAYSTTFTYAPTALFYGLTVPGVLELGPQLQFSVDAEISASEAVTITSEVTLALADGNVHVDLLDESNAGTSGWTPTYTASANISGEVDAALNPTAALTVEIAINFFGGLLDLSTGLTAKPGFNNSFILTAAKGVDLSGVQNLTTSGTCAEGLELASNFPFSVEAFVTEFYSTELYSVDLPILADCFSWE